MKKNARFVAIETLKRLQRSRKPVSTILDKVAGECDLKPGDRQLAMKISYGVLRQRDYIDRLLGRLCHRPINQLKPFIYQALSTGLFQLFLLDRIPPSAAVNETVKAVKNGGFPKQIQGFVNGVLRQSLRRKSELPRPEDSDAGNHPPLNHPDWLTKRWEARYGRQAMLQICSQNNKEPDLCLRVTPRTNRTSYLQLLEENNIKAAPGRYSAEAIFLPDFHGSVTKLPGFADGFFQVQDQAAQLATHLLAPFSPGNRYLDCCAGLGGKTVHLAFLSGPAGGSVTGVEPDAWRYRLLGENLARLCPDHGIRIYHTTLEQFAEGNPGLFEGILVDAPCTGTGIIGRQPDVRWNRRYSDLAIYQKRQIELLNKAAELLAPGGILVYATCSIEAEENSEVIANFLEHNSDFSLTDAQSYLPEKAAELIHKSCFSPLPAPGIDGFFAARLSKTEKND